MIYQRFNKVVALQCTGRSFTQNGAHITPQSLEDLLGGRFFVSKIKGLGSIPAILMKTDSITKVFLCGLAKIFLKCR